MYEIIEFTDRMLQNKQWIIEVIGKENIRQLKKWGIQREKEYKEKYK